MSDFEQPVIEEFRANRGNVGGALPGSRLVLLTTTGRRSGRPHTVPVEFLHDGNGRTLVIASAAGAEAHPQWYRNLLTEPRVTVETGAFTYTADAEVLDGAERDAAFARAAEIDPTWAEYQRRTDRVIPVVALRPVEGGPAEDLPWGDALTVIHDVFRRELAALRTEVARSGPRLGAQLRINCLALCRGLGHHHHTEDDGTFPLLDDANPELAGVLARLRAEHEAIAALLDRLRTVVADEGADAGAVADQVGQLTRQLEAHLDHEERELIPALNVLGAARA
ncbi:nitroreductase/quinone reductase family protein [Saccharomonospora iraqiensis]|uniref:nitroreductase/quinone reductase family protein n=1 Tax=Saccharomonospora iraqiensis TaxID=52698 RepID=UPI0003F67765|nr:nitroreductase/quinone reductase family protein [Saccharomonospora iraqiensis]